MQILYPYLPVDRRHALFTGRSLPGRTSGAALFADISGFTPLTGALAKELGRQRGAEKVLDYINPIYEALVTRLHSYRGAVISFAGDSITCWLDGDVGRRAAACALDMQEIMARFAQITTPGGNTVTLSIKISISIGPARRFLVGDPHIHNFEALAGTTLERMAAAEQQAEKGEIVVSEEVARSLGTDLKIREWRADDEGRRFAVIAGLVGETPLTPWPPLPGDALSTQQLRPWIDQPVFERLISGASYVAELRPVTSLFLKFGGIDYDEDDQAGEKLDSFIRWVQGILQQYEGCMLQLTIGDKGSNLLAVFGAPVAHDDDMARAVAAGLDLKSLPPELAEITTPKIGISQGMAWAGACGGRVRCIYTVMGDEVNMAARLMGKAAPGQVIVNQHVADAAGVRFQFNSLGQIQVKGRSEPLPVSEAVSRRETAASALAALFTSPLVGRESYLETMLAILQTAHGGHGQVLRLEGPAGVGKSHLAAVFARQAAGQGWQVVTGLAQSVSQNTPYLPWRQILNRLLGLDELPPEQRQGRLERILAEADPEWLLRLPVLGDLLGLPIPENEVTAMLEPRHRQLALFSLVSAILQTWARRQPLLIVLEDVHWLDEVSASLSISAARSLFSVPAVLLVVQRPHLQSNQPILPALDSLDYSHTIQLGDLAPEGVAALVRNRLGAPVSILAQEWIMAQAQGNPFFTEELVDALREAGYLVAGTDDQWDRSESAFQALLAAGCLVGNYSLGWHMVENPPLGAATLDIPDSVQGTVLARMDRLPEQDKLVLKVASVIGRTFALDLLNSVHPAAPGEAALASVLERVGERDFVRIEQPGQHPVFIFKHNTTQEVAYSTLLFAQRQALHQRVAAWYEDQAGNPPLESLNQSSPLALHYPLLAHHWRAAEHPEREKVYDRLAGDQAAARFANDSAVSYYSRALELTPESQPAERFDLLIGREAACDVLGRREQQKQDLVEMEQMPFESIGGSGKEALVWLRKGILQGNLSQLTEEMEFLSQALEKAIQANDVDVEILIRHEWGRNLIKREKYQEAGQALQQGLSLAIRESNFKQQGRMHYDLAMIDYNKANFAKAKTTFFQAQETFRQVNHRVGEIQCQYMLASIAQEKGFYGEAQEYLHQAYQQSRMIGYRYYEAYGIFTSGNLNFYLGRYDQSHMYHQMACQIWMELGDNSKKADSLDTLSLVAYVQGNFQDGQTYAQQAIKTHKLLKDSQRGLGFDLNHLGLILLAAGKLDDAHQQHQKALEIRRDSDQHALAIDDLAGLARVSLAQENIQQAAAYAQEIITGLDKLGSDGLEFPVWVYLTCWQAFSKVGDTLAAQQALDSGCQLLQKQASSIPDEQMRKGFLENVPWNREILAASTQ